MTSRPTTIDEVRQAVVQQPRMRIRGGGTKSLTIAGLTIDDWPVLDVSGLSGIVEHTPEECTFTALAGTRVAAIEERLAAHGQYLPFDPPFAAAGATIGGTVAAGASGSCRYRYGGIRDFLIGARIVDGKGRLVASGGKVVKNAAGFLLHQAMIGSAGRLGVLAELTFKVFPRAEAYATVRATASDLAAALAVLATARAGLFDLEAADIEAPATVWLRLGGAATALPARTAALRRALRVPTDALTGDDDDGVWRRAREFAWAPPDAALVRVPLTTSRVPALEEVLAAAGASRRYAIGGNVAMIAWPGALQPLASALDAQGLTGQVLGGPAGRPLIGRMVPNEFWRRVREVMDPDGRFGGDD